MSDAIIYYGFELGHPEGWLVQELKAGDEPGQMLIDVPWFDELKEDRAADEADFMACAMKILRRHAAPDAPGSSLGGRAPAQNETDRRLPAEIDLYCSHEAPSYVLYAWRTEAAQGSSLDITHLFKGQPERLTAWDDALDSALELPGITPWRPEPAWILASFSDD